jgi:hypothetical protein
MFPIVQSQWNHLEQRSDNVLAARIREFLAGRDEVVERSKRHPGLDLQAFAEAGVVAARAHGFRDAADAARLAYLSFLLTAPGAQPADIVTALALAPTSDNLDALLSDIATLVAGAQA